MIRTRIGTALSLSLGLCVACGGTDADLDAGMRDAGGTDAGSVEDAGRPEDGGDAGGADAGPSDAGEPDGGPGDAGASERRSWVAASLTIPQSASEATAVSLDLDGDGTRDNQLGQVVSAFVSAVGNDPRGELDERVQRGEVILLIEALAASFAADGAAEGRMLLGDDPTPAPCATPDDAICGAHLAGTGSFAVATPVHALSAGEIVSGRLAIGPAEAWLPLSLFGELALVPLREARVEADPSGAGLDAGILAGAITRADLDAIAIPALHAGAAAVVARDCDAGTCEPGSEGESALGIFDADGDGAITLEEVRTNALLGSLLAPDLDLDGDGTNDALSAGAGFTAVAATFASP